MLALENGTGNNLLIDVQKINLPDFIFHSSFRNMRMNEEIVKDAKALTVLHRRIWILNERRRYI